MTFFSDRDIINYVEVSAEPELTRRTQAKEFFIFFLKSDHLGTPIFFGGVFFFSFKIGEWIMRILHTGDLHLDSAFSSFSHKDAEQYREFGRLLLKNIFECAKYEKCQMILMAGDVFDSRFVSPDTKDVFLSLVRAIDIPVIVSPGNHDPYTENSFYSVIQKEKPDNLYIFDSTELKSIDFDDLRVRLFGYAFTSPVINESPLLSAELPQDNGYLKLLCAHADLASPISRYAPLSLTEILRGGFDYAALGHIHNCNDSEDPNGRVRYCGFAEGRSFDELGEGGVLIVDVDEDSCSVKKEVLSTRSFFIDKYVVPADSETLAQNISAFIKSKDYPQNTYLRLELTGAAESRTVKEIKAKTEEICEETELAYLEFLDSTLPVYDGSYLEKDVTVRGEIYRKLMPKLTSADIEERRQALLSLKIALTAIDGGNVFDIIK